MNTTGDFLPIFGLVYVVVVLVLFGWAMYLMYLATRALRKYLRS